MIDFQDLIPPRISVASSEPAASSPLVLLPGEELRLDSYYLAAH